MLKLAYLYNLTEKKKLTYMHLLLLSIVLCGYQDLKKEENDSSRIWSSVYIIYEKKRLVYMHIVIAQPVRPEGIMSIWHIAQGRVQ